MGSPEWQRPEVRAPRERKTLARRVGSPGTPRQPWDSLHAVQRPAHQCPRQFRIPGGEENVWSASLCTGTLASEPAPLHPMSEHIWQRTGEPRLTGAPPWGAPGRLHRPGPTVSHEFPSRNTPHLRQEG